MLARRMPWTSQPSAGTPIDWTHPLAAGLVFAFNGNGNYDAAGGRTPTVTGTVSGSTPGAKGISPNFTGSGSLNFGNDAALQPPTAITWGCWCRRTGTNTTYARPFGKTHNNGASPYLDYDFEFNVSGGNQNTVNIGVRGPWTLPITLADSTVPNFLIGMNSSAGFLAYVNGQQVNSTSGKALSYDTTSTGDLLVSGSSALSGTSSAFNGEVYFACVYNRVLTDAEILSLSTNPWQIFEG
jgi:hypothetical protein